MLDSDRIGPDEHDRLVAQAAVAAERARLDAEQVRLLLGIANVRDFLKLHRTATGRSDVNIAKVVALLDALLADPAPEAER